MSRFIQYFIIAIYVFSTSSVAQEMSFSGKLVLWTDGSPGAKAKTVALPSRFYSDASGVFYLDALGCVFSIQRVKKVIDPTLFSIEMGDKEIKNTYQTNFQDHSLWDDYLIQVATHFMGKVHKSFLERDGFKITSSYSGKLEFIRSGNPLAANDEIMNCESKGLYVTILGLERRKSYEVDLFLSVIDYIPPPYDVVFDESGFYVNLAKLRGTTIFPLVKDWLSPSEKDLAYDITGALIEQLIRSIGK